MAEHCYDHKQIISETCYAVNLIINDEIGTMLLKYLASYKICHFSNWLYH